jgi:hypothetical protein
MLDGPGVARKTRRNLNAIFTGSYDNLAIMTSAGQDDAFVFAPRHAGRRPCHLSLRQ